MKSCRYFLYGGTLKAAGGGFSFDTDHQMLKRPGLLFIAQKYVPLPFTGVPQTNGLRSYPNYLIRIMPAEGKKSAHVPVTLSMVYILYYSPFLFH